MEEFYSSTWLESNTRPRMDRKILEEKSTYRNIYFPIPLMSAPFIDTRYVFGCCGQISSTIYPPRVKFDPPRIEFWNTNGSLIIRWLVPLGTEVQPRFALLDYIRAVSKCRCSSGHGCPDLLRFVAIEHALFLLRQSWSLEFIGKVIVVKNFSNKVTLQIVIISLNNFYLYRILEYYRILIVSL